MSRHSLGFSGVEPRITPFEWVGQWQNRAQHRQRQSKRGKGLRLSASKRTSHANPHNLYAVPHEKSVARFKDQIRNLTQRRAPVRLRDMIEVINPIIRGWGNYYRKANRNLPLAWAAAVMTRTGGACIPPSRAQPAPVQIARHDFEVAERQGHHIDAL